MDRRRSVRDLVPDLKGVDVTIIVLDKLGSEITRAGTMHTYHVADASGSVEMVVFNELDELLASGDILAVQNAFTSLHAGRLLLYIGKRSTLARTGTFELAIAYEPNMSRVRWAVDPARPKLLAPAAPLPESA